MDNEALAEKILKRMLETGWADSGILARWLPNMVRESEMFKAILLLLQTSQGDSNALQSRMERLKEALRGSKHALIISNNLLVTDRPDLVNWPKDICWTLKHDGEIAAINKALTPPLEGE